jgi:hypothetical protein
MKVIFRQFPGFTRIVIITGYLRDTGLLTDISLYITQIFIYLFNLFFQYYRTGKKLAVKNLNLNSHFCVYSNPGFLTSYIVFF